MPWPSNHLPKYRKHRGSGQAVVTLNGRDFYLGPHSTKASKLEYDRLIGEWLASGRNSLHGPTGETTVVELCTRYLQFAKGYYRKNGRNTNVIPALKCSLRYLREWYGKQPAVEFGPLALKAVRERMVEEGLSRRYINDHIDRIKRMFKWAVAEELVPSSVAQALFAVSGLRKGRSGARETEAILPVDDAIVEATLPCLPEVVADMVRLQRITAMRPAEVCILRPCDLDRASDIWLYRPGSHKTEHHGRDRVVTLGPNSQGILLRYLARDPQTFCFRPCDSEQKRRALKHSDRKTPLNCGNRPGKNGKPKPKRTAGDQYDSCSYRRAIHRACDKAFPHPELGSKVRKDMTDAQVAELKNWQSDHHWSPNQLRHAAATEIRREFGLEAAQVVLGHSSANVTQVYAERDFAKALEYARRRG
ncbi:tyrosine-type recombinase/integrase [Bythopirellula polymerisocia]|uniref:Site-specific tyrosine recombinase XerC n=1 Tax=Bythopirellula polymerisocia TaxID=2528003 RepID=A0A5C6CSW4_9BACT|nr:site-specific integrase [Bythopirellula polymerisocia]TWU27622.1 site-specific tyrosine recombinase XerC [Bythopirellula polymerisocia]